MKLLFPFLLLLLSSCQPAAGLPEAPTYRVEGDTVFIAQNDSIQGKLKLALVQLMPYTKEVITAGTVQPIPTQFAYIAPPFSGRIVRSFVKLGQKVKANTALFEISSPEYTAAQKDFFQARFSKELAQKELTRKEDLLANGVGSAKEFEEALHVLQLADKEYENTFAALRVYQVDPLAMTFGHALLVRSPLAGKVIANSIVTGQYTKDDAEPIATIADLSQVWVTAQVKEKDIRFVHVGSAVKIALSAFPDREIQGEVFHIEESVDESTRSIRVLVLCDNKEELLKIGMYSTVHLFDTATARIHIPEKALLQDAQYSYVFVAVQPNAYVRRPVVVESLKNGLAVIAEGLATGETIISAGAYYLK